MVTLDILHGFLQELYAQRCKARTIARKIASLKTFFGFLAEKYGIINIAASLATPKCESTLPRYLSEDEVIRLLNVAQQDTSEYGMRNYIMVMFLYSTGLRISELLGLHTTDIRFDTRTVLVNGKGNKQRIVPLPEELVPLLTHYMTALTKAHEDALILFRASHTSNYLFPSYYGNSKKPLTRQAFWQLLRKLCSHAGIDRAISPHQLRHSLATHLLRRGADLRSLQLLLGHETLSTMHVYTHLDTTALRGVYDKKHVRS
jgi:site-specific recombinase XerD